MEMPGTAGIPPALGTGPHPHWVNAGQEVPRACEPKHERITIPGKRFRPSHLRAAGFYTGESLSA